MSRRLSGGAGASAYRWSLVGQALSPANIESKPSPERKRWVPIWVGQTSRFASRFSNRLRNQSLTLVLLVFLCSTAWAAALPDQLGSFRKIESSPVSLTDEPIWSEFGLAASETGKYEAKGKKLDLTAYRFKDTTGALAAWEWLRSPNAKPCQLAPFCAETTEEKLLFDLNYVLILRNSNLKKSGVAAIFQALPDTHETSLPPVLTSVPREGLVPNSARYVLGPASFRKFEPALATVNPGFEQGVEAHLTSYLIDGKPVRLALFHYPTPEMARLHQSSFQKIPQAVVKRSGPLVAVVVNPASEQQANTLLSRVEYQAHITWNEVPPGNPVRTLYELFGGIIVLSLVLVGLCAAAGAVYAGLRVYRRSHGNLESEEAMTTLNLRAD